MHELAVVDSLLRQLEAETNRLGVTARVAVVHLRLGKLTTFVPDAITFYFDALKKGTPLAAARLAVEEVPVAGTCRNCGAAVVVEELPFLCAACGSADLDITSGRELEITSLEISGDEAP
jgi:hydrogenase nickel incorporation protein HypA/HybF